MNEKELLDQAKNAREKAYVPYSNFAVGAAILGKSGQVYLGCNIENASYGLTVCAERVALFKALSEGEREFSALAVVADTEAVCSPCGACRQVLAEFGSEMVVLMGNLRGNVERKKVEELLPGFFHAGDLTRGG